MYPRTNYEMTEADLEKILDACKPVPMIMLQCGAPSSPQENANRAWAELGRRMGFDHMTVQPTGRGDRFFTAVPSETEEHKKERLAREAGLPDGALGMGTEQGDVLPQGARHNPAASD